MHAKLRSAAVAAAAAMFAGALVAPAQAAHQPVATTPIKKAPENDLSIKAVFDPEAPVTANWTREQALRIERTPATTTPVIPEDFPVMTEDLWVWDTWPLTDLQGNPVSYKGWNVIFSLTAPRDIGFTERHGVASISYFYSRNARDWTYGGELFPEGTARGARQWAGSMILTEGNQVHAFYTASGEDDTYDPELTDFLQRLAHSPGRIYADRDGVFFRGLTEHDIMAEADGEIYQTLEQSQAGPIIYAFRDPWVYRDPVDGNIYALFEGNNAGEAGSHTCDPWEIGDVPAGHEVPEDARYYTGNIGLLQLEADRLHPRRAQEWTLLPPLLSAECVNQQTERPHLTIHDGRYYLWTISHEFTYAPGLTGPDGLYGFVGDGLRSDYRPLNGSALVLGNPPEAPLQNYSHYVMPNLLVESFIDQVPTEDGVRDGGTLAPTLELEIFGAQGQRTRLDGVLPYGYIPALRSGPLRGPQ